jgi:hypothetical protein
MQYEDAVNMVGHDHVRAQFGAGKMLGDQMPAFVGDRALLGQLHPAFFDGSKETHPALHDDRNKIRPRPGVSRKTDLAPIMCL